MEQMEQIKLKYPIYVPSKGRYERCLTANFLIKDNCPFYLVVEPQEKDEYGSRYGYDRLLILPWEGDDSERREFCKTRGIENGGLIAVRNWIKEHSIANGDKRHWQIDDNCRHTVRRYKTYRIHCDANIALGLTEQFIDRYENIAIAGLNYEFFVPDRVKTPPFRLNVHIYSCSLILNEIPHKWRIKYNDDTDLCLQVLSAGWCTIQMCIFLIKKEKTMTIKGGNTDDLYQGDGRLKMARSLERMWPGVVTVNRRFQRPQHVVKDAWKRFDNKLIRRSDIDFNQFPEIDEFGIKLNQVKDIKSPEIKKIYEGYKQNG